MKWIVSKAFAKDKHCTEVKEEENGDEQVAEEEKEEEK